MVYRFIATTLFNGNKRLTMHSYREQMRNHNGRQYHLQSGQLIRMVRVSGGNSEITVPAGMYIVNGTKVAVQ